ncbi:mechanosensitive ion channel family protein [Aurantiacibacter sp. D1-12]|uniref:mechanosensitive ion channel family protein n=1 Tax=Aurantiacibacter sp. D1-12 TaxID=2993658 RepID=UPI00237CE993|nr:mechanosensitive ion channel domain-containing protein [Aurantiacibacter sp. D1-12]MDE1466926.1 mechanosensitive ion channel [Aurantiacibacter sp. D1-12]
MTASTTPTASAAVSDADAVPLRDPATGDPLIDPETGDQLVGVPAPDPVPVLDPETGEPMVDPETGEPLLAIPENSDEVPDPEATEAISTAAELGDAVSERSETIGGMVNSMQGMALEVGSMRISLWDVFVVFFVIVLVLTIAWMITKALRGGLKRVTKLDESQRVLVEKIATIIIWVAAFLIGIDVLGIDLTALAVFSGAFGLAIGFGLQKTFGNLISGIILLMDKSIKPGDVISVTDQAGNDSFGQIRKIGIRAISVVTRDQTEYLIPNENLMINQVVNWSYSSKDVRVKAPVGVSYGADLDLVQELLYQAVNEVPRVLKSPKPRVNLMGFGDSSVDFELRFWIKDPEEGMANIRSDVYTRIWQLFKEHEVEIPFPQRDLNLRGGDQMQQLIEAIAQRVETKKNG